MSEQDNTPSPWEIIQDYTKTVITLATAILAFTITFATKLTGPAPDFYMKLLIALTWSVLVLAIIFGLWAAARLTNFLRGKQTANACLFASNIAFFLLVLAGIMFVLIGIRHISSGSDLSIKIDSAEKEAKVITKSQDPWKMLSLHWNKKSENYEITYRFGTTSSIIRITMEDKSGKILGIEEIKSNP